MKTRAALLVVAAGAVAMACGQKKKAPAITIEHFHVQLQFPVFGTGTNFEATCANASSLLLSLDTGNGNGWEYRLLTDLDGNLYGCNGDPSAPCAANEVRFGLSKLRRIMVEGITADPGVFASGESFDVACRGIAGNGEPGTLVMTGSTAQAAVPMLRLGESNGLFVASGPATYWPAGGALAGTVVIGGGEDPGPGTPTAEVWRFDPSAIAFTADAPLQTARTRMRATEVPNWQGDDAVVFTGGLELTTRSTKLDAYRRQGAPATGDLPLPTAQHAAAFAPLSWAGQGGAIVVAGGCDFPPDFNLVTDQAQFVLPSMPQNDPPRPFLICVGLAGGSPQEGKPAVCKDISPSADHAMTSPAFCHLDAVPQQNAGQWTIWLGGGGRNASGTDSFTNDMAIYDPDMGSFTYDMTFPVTDFRSATSIAIDATHSLLLGGLVDSGATPQVLLEQAGSILDVSSNGTLAVARGAASATRLADGSILVAGGLDAPDGNDLDSLEIVTFDPATPGITTLYPLRLDGSHATLAHPRSHHVAIAIRGSGTWLDGSVVIAGGSSTGTVLPELFVPTTPCGSGVADCDRGVTAADRPLTDPSVKSPKPLGG